MQLIEWLQALTFWHWMVLGTVLVVLEILLPGIWFLWLGLGALVTGGITFLLPALSWEIQVTVFCALSIVSVIAGRMVMRRRGEPLDHPLLNRRGAQYIGKQYRLEEATSNGQGRVRIGDTLWRVELATQGAELDANTAVTVTGVDGTTLQVAPAPAAADH